MGKPKVLELTETERLALEKGFRLGEKHCFRMRCRAVLLKADGLSSAAGVQTEMSHVSVNAWVKRFKSEGIDGLNTRSGRGRKPIMDCLDEEVVRRAIEQDRQSVSKARAAWEQRGLFLFFLPPYSPQLNIAETLWRILKGKWIRPQDYITSDMLFYTTNRALADIGKGLRINFSKHVA